MQEAVRGTANPQCLHEASASPDIEESCEELAKQISLAVASEVEHKILESSKNLWQHGQEAFRQLTSESRSRQKELSEKVSEFCEQQERLQQESAELRHFLTDAMGQLAAVAPALQVPMQSFSTCNDPSLLSTDVPASSLTSLMTPVAPTELNSYNCDACQEGLDCGEKGTLPKLPPVPPFPFHEKLPASKMSLSLASALGIDEGASFSLAAHQSLQTHWPMSGDTAADTWSDAEPDVFIFKVTLEKAHGADLGIVTSVLGQRSGVLRVDSIIPGGSAEAWNQWRRSSGSAEDIILPGDSIVDVNGLVADTATMKTEWEHETSLRLMIVRSDREHAPVVNVDVAGVRLAKSCTTLSADATVFVPGAPVPTHGAIII